MEKKVWLRISFVLALVFSLVVSGCSSSTAGGSAPAAAPTIGDLFTKVITLEFLKDMGILSSTLPPVEGFTRFLLLIFIFVLLYGGARFVPIGDNARIVLAAVISLISVIFMPSAVILATATSYGTLFSLLFLGLPIAAGVAGFFFLKDHLWLRAALMGFVIWMLGQMKDHIGSWSSNLGTASVSYLTVITTVQNWIGWVQFLLFMFLLVTLVQGGTSFFTGHSHGQMDIKSTAKNIWNRVNSSTRREKTALMNEYITDEQELNLLDEAEQLKEDALSEVDAVVRQGRFQDSRETDRIVNGIKNLQTKLEEALNHFRRTTNRTGRAQRAVADALTQLKEVKKELKEKGKDTTNIETLEAQILKKHKDAMDATKVIISDLEKLKPVLDFLERIPNASYPILLSVIVTLGGRRMPFSAILQLLRTVLENKAKLDLPRAAQKEVMTSLQGIITEAHDLMKV